ncbi:hypothetical protein [Microbulbifer discodermiae]|uniref:hypothetical protein n=1 Tax=Microbulbifer sp. 2201CG32-9 TaxID=3232309 RepID=UPI00345BBD2B
MTLKSSQARWRLIQYQTQDGNGFEFPANAMSLTPGVGAFLYLRRWGEEKHFDIWQNDFGSSKAWSRGKTGLAARGWLAIMTSLYCC